MLHFLLQELLYFKIAFLFYKCTLFLTLSASWALAY